MDSQQVETLLRSDESETIERKAGYDHKEVRKTLIAFANDLSGRDRGWLILGQAPNKDIVGLKMGADELQRRIADIAKDECRPTIPVSIEVIEHEGKTLAIVEVRSSLARPHFDGDSWVRVGSTTRAATDAEITLLRSVQSNRKVALLQRWFNKGKVNITLVNVPRHERMRGLLLDFNEDWVKLQLGDKLKAIPLAELSLNYDYENDRPEIRHIGAT